MTERLSLPPNIDYLFDTRTIRQRCQKIASWAETGKLKYWQLELRQFESVCDFVCEVIKGEYPDLEIPYHGRWRHIDTGKKARIADFLSELGTSDRTEQARALFELTLVSVLVDAGAGMAWKYCEPDTEDVYTKSEGLAVAAYHMQLCGELNHEGEGFSVTGRGLLEVTQEKMQSHFQVTADNPMIGLKGRTSLLQSVGHLITSKNRGFEKGERLAEMFDFIMSQSDGEHISARLILKNILTCLGPIWPGRMVLNGYNLGDCWEHYALMDEQRLAGVMPFHKLSQWLTYSLFEVFEHAGLRITEMDELTGLPEYRNGGLFMDKGLLQLKDRNMLQQAWSASDELIIEWRALTVYLLDKVAERLREKLGLDSTSLPLAKVLQGGTWLAGRIIAKELRTDGGPPLAIRSDGTVF